MTSLPCYRPRRDDDVMLPLSVACPRRDDKKNRHRDEAVTASFSLAKQAFTAPPNAIDATICIATGVITGAQRAPPDEA